MWGEWLFLVWISAILPPVCSSELWWSGFMCLKRTASRSQNKMYFWKIMSHLTLLWSQVFFSPSTSENTWNWDRYTWVRNSKQSFQCLRILGLLGKPARSPRDLCMINVEDRAPTAFLSISNTAAKDWKAPPESLSLALCGCKQTMVHNPFNKMITFHLESH